MFNEASQFQEQEAVNAAFMCNHRGDVCIIFSDPLYARSESILIDQEDLSVHAILQENNYFLGNISERMMQAFEDNENALLAALKSDGSVLELEAPIEIALS